MKKKNFCFEDFMRLVSKEGKTTEGYLEETLQERINMLLKNFDRGEPQSDEESRRLLMAEKILDRLPRKQRRPIEYYISDIIKRMSLEESYLYKQGFFDAVRIFNKFITFYISDH